MSLQLAKDLYDGKLDSSFLREPWPLPAAGMPEGAIDNRFKMLVDVLVADWARAGRFSVSADPDPATQAREAAAEIEARG
jgi:hypothetical protein